MAQEIEFKLSIAPEQASVFWRTLRSRFPALKPETHTLFSAYYDTPAGDLRKNGVALRLRRQAGRWIQTIKGEGTVSAGLHRRSEHETEVAAQLPSFPAMADAGLGELIADRETRESLGVVFSTEFERSSALLQPKPGTAIEIALDRGLIAAGKHREAICEIELELKSGDTGALFDLARTIAADFPVRLDNRSKAERGYALAANARPAPVKAGPSPLRPGMRVDEAFVALAFDCLAHLQTNERGVIDGRNPEYRHQARVALRRLRSLFRTFAPIFPEAAWTALLGQVKHLAHTLGDARNLDVFLDETLARAGSSVHPGMRTLKRRTQAARRKAARAASAALSDRSHALLMLSLSEALMNHALPADPESRPVAEFAGEALARHHAKVRKRGRNIRKLAFEDLHRMRIAVKRLRYSMEFFEPLAPRKAQDALEALSGLQDLLGRLNDAATAWKLLDTLAVEDPTAEFQQAIGYVRGWTARDGEQCRQELAEAWKDFDKLDRWWRRT